MAASADLDQLAAALFDLIGALNNPRQDDVLLAEADVSLDRALFPLVARLGALGPMGVAQLADHAGRDYTTISRQLAVLERQGLIERQHNARDSRVREARLTTIGSRVAKRIADARRRLLGQLLSDWKVAEREAFTLLARKMAEGMKNLREHKAAELGI
jgi:DNA-binding MarR family transcriptional regulator